MGRNRKPFEIDFKIQQGAVIYDPEREKTFVMVTIGKNLFLWDGRRLSKEFSSYSVKVALSNPTAIDLMKYIYIDDLAVWAEKYHSGLTIEYHVDHKDISENPHEKIPISKIA